MKKQIARALNDAERAEFSEKFYDHPDVTFDDMDTPTPYGCPWYWGSDIYLKGDDIDEMVDNFVCEWIDELTKVQS